MNKRIRKAFKLREKYKTYSEISKELGVSKAVLSSWFKGLDWSEKIAAENHRRNYAGEKIMAMQAARKALRGNRDLRFGKDIERTFTLYKGKPLFAAGLMLYLASGDLSQKNNLVRLTSSDPRIIAIYKEFLDTYCARHSPFLKVTLISYPNLDETRCQEWWAALVKVEKTQFLRTQMITARNAPKELLYGLATLTISSKSLKMKLFRWIELSSRDLSQRTWQDISA